MIISSGDALSVQLDSSAMESQSGEDQRPCEVDHRGCDNSFFQNLNWSTHAVERRTGIEFPTILDNLIAGERNSSFISEVNMSNMNYWYSTHNCNGYFS